ncbi:hypothetical protein BV20DRAFT_189915 [Pilatotrama ljubarskyi]|nr:hypothetical protein BV20DRAFT_189915 [Pilatotrama ljubarskyi]
MVAGKCKRQRNSAHARFSALVAAILRSDRKRKTATSMGGGSELSAEGPWRAATLAVMSLQSIPEEATAASSDDLHRERRRQHVMQSYWVWDLKRQSMRPFATHIGIHNSFKRHSIQYGGLHLETPSVLSQLQVYCIVYRAFPTGSATCHTYARPCTLCRHQSTGLQSA